jgi:hypothetical protein
LVRCSDIERSVTQDRWLRQLTLFVPFLASGCLGFATVRPRETRESVATDATTPDQLLDAWGAPDAKRSVDGDEIWSYEQDRRWAGVILIPVVPVPLLLPVAHDRVEFRFRDDTLVDARVWKVGARGALCGLAIGPCSSPGCYVDR